MEQSLGVRVPPSAPSEGAFMTKTMPTAEEKSIILVEDGTLSKKYKITLKGPTLLSHVQPFLDAKAKKARMPGFRPGKVPMEKVFAQYCGEAIEYAIETCINREVKNLLEEHKWSLVTQPRYEMLSFPSISSLQSIGSSSADISVEFVLNPIVQEYDTTKFSIPKYSVTFSPEYIQKALEKAASTSFTSEPLESPRAAQKGDTIVYFLEYFDDKGVIKSMEGMFQLGSNLFPPEFQESFLGASAGHTVEERIRVPKNFPDKDLAGRKVTFKLLFSEIRHTVPHKVDDAFAKTYGCDNVEILRQHFTEKFTKKSHNDVQEMYQKILHEQMDSVLSFEIPESLVHETSLYLWEMMLSDVKKSHDVKGQNFEWNTLSDGIKAKIRAHALASLRRRFFLNALAEKKGINVTQNDTMAALEAIAKNRGVSVEQLAQYFQKNRAELKRFHEGVQEMKAEEFILAHCARPEETISAEEMEKKKEELIARETIETKDVLASLVLSSPKTTSSVAL